MRLQFGHGKQDEAMQAKQNRESLIEPQGTMPVTEAQETQNAQNIETRIENTKTRRESKQQKQQATRPNVSHATAQSPIASIGRVLGVVFGLLLISSIVLQKMTDQNIFEWIKETNFTAAYSQEGLAKSRAVAQMNLGNFSGALDILKTMPPNASRAGLLQEVIQNSRDAKKLEVTLQASVLMSETPVVNSIRENSGTQELAQAVQMMYAERGFEKTFAFTQQGNVFTPAEKETLLPALVPYFPASQLDNTLKMVEAITNIQKKEVGYLNIVPLYLYQDQLQKAREITHKITDDQTRLSALQSLLNARMIPISNVVGSNKDVKMIKMPFPEVESILEEIRKLEENIKSHDTSYRNYYDSAIASLYNNYLNEKDFINARKITLLNSDRKTVLNNLEYILMQMTVFQNSNPPNAEILSLVKEMGNIAMQINDQQTYSRFDSQLISIISNYRMKKDEKFAKELAELLFDPVERQKVLENSQRR
jgi:hypothetical protein